MSDDLLNLIRRSNANGRVTAPESDEWGAYFDSATPEGRRAMATGARARAIRAEARVAELEAAAQPEPEPDPKAEFRQKNHQLLGRLIGRPATPNQEK